MRDNRSNRWDELTNIVIDMAQRLESADADFIIISTNTMHKMDDEIQENIGIPILHIVDVTARKIIERNVNKIGLLWTKFTMEENLYKYRLKEKYSIDVVISKRDDRELIHRIIYNELCLGIIKRESKLK